MGKSIYISCHDSYEASRMAAALIEAGHRICSIWHGGTEQRPPDGDSVEWGFKAKDNLDIIRDHADIFVLIASQGHLSREFRVPGGKFVEAGFAIARRSLHLIQGVFTVGGVENGMLWHPHVEHVGTVEELIEALKEKK